MSERYSINRSFTSNEKMSLEYSSVLVGLEVRDFKKKIPSTTLNIFGCSKGKLMSLRLVDLSQVKKGDNINAEDLYKVVLNGIIVEMDNNIEFIEIRFTFQVVEKNYYVNDKIDRFLLKNDNWKKRNLFISKFSLDRLNEYFDGKLKDKDRKNLLEKRQHDVDYHHNDFDLRSFPSSSQQPQPQPLMSNDYDSRHCSQKEKSRDDFDENPSTRKESLRVTSKKGNSSRLSDDLKDCSQQSSRSNSSSSSGSSFSSHSSSSNGDRSYDNDSDDESSGRSSSTVSSSSSHSSTYRSESSSTSERNNDPFIHHSTGIPSGIPSGMPRNFMVPPQAYASSGINPTLIPPDVYGEKVHSENVRSPPRSSTHFPPHMSEQSATLLSNGEIMNQQMKYSMTGKDSKTSYYPKEEFQHANYMGPHPHYSDHQHHQFMISATSSAMTRNNSFPHQHLHLLETGGGGGGGGGTEKDEIMMKSPQQYNTDTGEMVSQNFYIEPLTLSKVFGLDHRLEMNIRHLINYLVTIDRLDNDSGMSQLKMVYQPSLSLEKKEEDQQMMKNELEMTPFSLPMVKLLKNENSLIKLNYRNNFNCSLHFFTHWEMKRVHQIRIIINSLNHLLTPSNTSTHLIGKVENLQRCFRQKVFRQQFMMSLLSDDDKSLNNHPNNQMKSSQLLTLHRLFLRLSSKNIFEEFFKNLIYFTLFPSGGTVIGLTDLQSLKLHDIFSTILLSLLREWKYLSIVLSHQYLLPNRMFILMIQLNYSSRSLVVMNEILHQLFLSHSVVRKRFFYLSNKLSGKKFKYNRLLMRFIARNHFNQFHIIHNSSIKFINSIHLIQLMREWQQLLFLLTNKIRSLISYSNSYNLLETGEVNENSLREQIDSSHQLINEKLAIHSKLSSRILNKFPFDNSRLIIELINDFSILIYATNFLKRLEKFPELNHHKTLMGNLKEFVLFFVGFLMELKEKIPVRFLIELKHLKEIHQFTSLFIRKSYSFFLPHCHSVYIDTTSLCLEWNKNYFDCQISPMDESGRSNSLKSFFDLYQTIHFEVKFVQLLEMLKEKEEMLKMILEDFYFDSFFYLKNSYGKQTVHHNRFFPFCLLSSNDERLFNYPSELSNFSYNFFHLRKKTERLQYLQLVRSINSYPNLVNHLRQHFHQLIQLWSIPKKILFDYINEQFANILQDQFHSDPQIAFNLLDLLIDDIDENLFEAIRSSNSDRLSDYLQDKIFDEHFPLETFLKVDNLPEICLEEFLFGNSSKLSRQFQEDFPLTCEKLSSTITSTKTMEKKEEEVIEGIYLHFQKGKNSFEMKKGMKMESMKLATSLSRLFRMTKEKNMKTIKTTFEMYEWKMEENKKKKKEERKRLKNLKMMKRERMKKLMNEKKMNEKKKLIDNRLIEKETIRTVRSTQKLSCDNESSQSKRYPCENISNHYDNVKQMIRVDGNDYNSKKRNDSYRNFSKEIRNDSYRKDNQKRENRNEQRRESYRSEKDDRKESYRNDKEEWNECYWTEKELERHSKRNRNGMEIRKEEKKDIYQKDNRNDLYRNDNYRIVKEDNRKDVECETNNWTKFRKDLDERMILKEIRNDLEEKHNRRDVRKDLDEKNFCRDNRNDFEEKINRRDVRKELDEKNHCRENRKEVEEKNNWREVPRDHKIERRRLTTTSTTSSSTGKKSMEEISFNCVITNDSLRAFDNRVKDNELLINEKETFRDLPPLINHLDGPTTTTTTSILTSSTNNLEFLDNNRNFNRRRHHYDQLDVMIQKDDDKIRHRSTFLSNDLKSTRKLSDSKKSYEHRFDSRKHSIRDDSGGKRRRENERSKHLRESDRPKRGRGDNDRHRTVRSRLSGRDKNNRNKGRNMKTERILNKDNYIESIQNLDGMDLMMEEVMSDGMMVEDNQSTTSNQKEKHQIPYKKLRRMKMMKKIFHLWRSIDCRTIPKDFNMKQKRLFKHLSKTLLIILDDSSILSTFTTLESFYSSSNDNVDGIPSNGSDEILKFLFRLLLPLNERIDENYLDVNQLLNENNLMGKYEEIDEDEMEIGNGKKNLKSKHQLTDCLFNHLLHQIHDDYKSINSLSKSICCRLVDRLIFDIDIDGKFFLDHSADIKSICEKNLLSANLIRLFQENNFSFLKMKKTMIELNRNRLIIDNEWMLLFDFILRVFYQKCLQVMSLENDVKCNFSSKYLNVEFIDNLTRTVKRLIDRMMKCFLMETKEFRQMIEIRFMDRMLKDVRMFLNIFSNYLQFSRRFVAKNLIETKNSFNFIRKCFVENFVEIGFHLYQLVTMRNLNDFQIIVDHSNFHIFGDGNVAYQQLPFVWNLFLENIELLYYVTSENDNDELMEDENNRYFGERKHINLILRKLFVTFDFDPINLEASLILLGNLLLRIEVKEKDLKLFIPYLQHIDHYLPIIFESQSNSLKNSFQFFLRSFVSISSIFNEFILRIFLQHIFNRIKSKDNSKELMNEKEKFKGRQREKKENGNREHFINYSHLFNIIDDFTLKELFNLKNCDDNIITSIYFCRKFILDDEEPLIVEYELLEDLIKCIHHSSIVRLRLLSLINGETNGEMRRRSKKNKIISTLIRMLLESSGMGEKENEMLLISNFIKNIIVPEMTVCDNENLNESIYYNQLSPTTLFMFLRISLNHILSIKNDFTPINLSIRSIYLEILDKLIFVNYNESEGNSEKNRNYLIYISPLRSLYLFKCLEEVKKDDVPILYRQIVNQMDGSNAENIEQFVRTLFTFYCRLIRMEEERGSIIYKLWRHGHLNDDESIELDYNYFGKCRTILMDGYEEELEELMKLFLLDQLSERMRNYLRKCSKVEDGMKVPCDESKNDEENRRKHMANMDKIEIQHLLQEKILSHIKYSIHTSEEVKERKDEKKNFQRINLVDIMSTVPMYNLLLTTVETERIKLFIALFLYQQFIASTFATMDNGIIIENCINAYQDHIRKYRLTPILDLRGDLINSFELPSNHHHSNQKFRNILTELLDDAKFRDEVDEEHEKNFQLFPDIPSEIIDWQIAELTSIHHLQSKQPNRNRTKEEKKHQKDLTRYIALMKDEENSDLNESDTTESSFTSSDVDLEHLMVNGKLLDEKKRSNTQSSKKKDGEKIVDDETTNGDMTTDGKNKDEKEIIGKADEFIQPKDENDPKPSFPPQESERQHTQDNFMMRSLVQREKMFPKRGGHHQSKTLRRLKSSLDSSDGSCSIRIPSKYAFVAPLRGRGFVSNQQPSSMIPGISGTASAMKTYETFQS
ncbi:hypothetical protein SNEBB_003283 [Seison nebaliae]|nr:hypothetical protein SNEBB_003283 [Seison nebaliae]